MTTAECIALTRERQQLTGLLGEKRLFLNRLRHEWMLGDGLTRARFAGQIDIADADIRQTEERLDEIALQLDSGRCDQPTTSNPPPPSDPAFAFDVFISYRQIELDLTWVWTELVPRLETASLRFACAGDTPPGVSNLTGTENLFMASRRVLAVLTEGYLSQASTRFESIMAQAQSIQGGLARLIPIFLEDIDLEHPPSWTPLRLSPLVVNPVVLGPAALARGQRIPRLNPWAKLVATLQSPLPVL